MAIRIDQKYIKLLNMMQANCRTKLQRLADHTGLTTSPVHDRILMLERDGYIRRYAAVINKEKFGLYYRAFVQIRLVPGSASAFGIAVNDFYEVECAYRLSDDSFLLLVVVEDVCAYSQFIIRRLQGTGLVADHKTMVIKSELKAFACLPDVKHIKEISGQPLKNAMPLGMV